MDNEINRFTILDRKTKSKFQEIQEKVRQLNAEMMIFNAQLESIGQSGDSNALLNMLDQIEATKTQIDL